MKTFLFLITVSLTVATAVVLYQHEARHLTSHAERLSLAVEAATQ